jgi:hypothetical protein
VREISCWSVELSNCNILNAGCAPCI